MQTTNYIIDFKTSPVADWEPLGFFRKHMDAENLWLHSRDVFKPGASWRMREVTILNGLISDEKILNQL